MHRFSPILASGWLAVLCGVVVGAVSAPAQTAARATVRAVRVLHTKGAVEIEVEASDRIIPQTRVLTGPDRFVVDFPNATPAMGARNQAVNRGEVKDVRVGLFQSQPPITRVVLDLKSAQSYQVFPYGRTVMIKVTSGALEASIDMDGSTPEPPARPGLVIANYTAGSERIHSSTEIKPGLDVSFRNGLLTIRANKVTLSEVLNAVQLRTGAEIDGAAGVTQEKVVVNLGPAPAAEVLAALLNGSKFNYLILSAANNPQQLDKVILSPRGAAVVTPQQAQPQEDEMADEEPARPAPVTAPVVNAVPQAMPPPVPHSGPENKPEEDSSEQ
jgi:AMIN domain